MLAAWVCFLTRVGYLSLVAATRGKVGIFLERVISVQVLLLLGKLQKVLGTKPTSKNLPYRDVW